MDKVRPSRRPNRGVFAEHQRERGEIRFVQNECLRLVLKIKNRLRRGGAVVLKLDPVDRLDRDHNFLGEIRSP